MTQWGFGFESFDGDAPLWDEADLVIVDRGPHVEIIWETGPCEWTYSFPNGGIDPEYGRTVPAVEVGGGLRAGWDFDAQTSFSLAVCR